MKNTLSIICLFVFSVFYTQKISVLDAETQKPIPYAKLILKGKDYYRNTEENGEITLEKDEEVSEIQSFGYENLLVQENKAKYFLKPKVINIKEVQLEKPKFENSKNVGTLNGDIFGFGGLAATWTVANFFPYQENYSQTKFIKSVRFLSNFNKKSKGKIKLVFYKNEDGRPSENIWKTYIVECKKAEKLTEYKLERPIPFPHDGLYVGFEWIVNKENTFKQKLHLKTDSTWNVVYRDYNTIRILADKTSKPEMWVLGKLIWDTSEGMQSKSGPFHQEGWLKYEDFVNKDFNYTKDDFNKRLSVQLELTD